MPAESLPKRLAARAMDGVESILYRNRLLPPFSMRRLVGEAEWNLDGQNFAREGRHILEKLMADANLRPESRVLDVGSGCGRIALPLLEVLGPSGRYVGFDPIEPAVRWCQREISPRFPHFQFIHCDIRHPAYNPRGPVEPETFRFPFETGSFHLAIAVSVFTHLLPRTAENYVGECGRVLRTGGRFFGTFFLVESGCRSCDGRLNFVHPQQHSALSADANQPERAVAFKTDWLLHMFAKFGMKLVGPVRWGGWAGRQPSYCWWHDVLIFEKQI